MPESCYIPGCHSRRGKGGTLSLHFYRLPSDPDTRHLWLISIKKNIIVSEHTRICSLHFVGSEKSPEHPLPTIFPWSEPPHPRKKPAEREPLAKKARIESESSDDESEEYDEREKRIEKLEEELAMLKADRVERFGVKRFQGSDEDIRFYTGLPTYRIFLCLFNFIICHYLTTCTFFVLTLSTSIHLHHVISLDLVHYSQLMNCF